MKQTRHIHVESGYVIIMSVIKGFDCESSVIIRMYHPAIVKALARPRIESHTPMWYAARERTLSGKSRLTASDLASVLGLNPYCSRKLLFRRKTGQTARMMGNFATAWGHKYEDEAAQAYEKTTGKLLVRGDNGCDLGLFIHDVYDQFGASPDRIAKDFPILIEIKCPVRRKITHNIPEYYYPQVQMQLWILDLEECHFVQYKPADLFTQGELDILVVHRDHKFMEDALPKMIAFVEEVDAYIASNAKLPPKPVPVKKAVVKDSSPKTFLWAYERETDDGAEPSSPASTFNMKVTTPAFKSCMVVKMDDDVWEEDGGLKSKSLPHGATSHSACPGDSTVLNGKISTEFLRCTC